MQFLFRSLLSLLSGLLACSILGGCGYQCESDPDFERGLEIGKYTCDEICALGAGQELKRVWHESGDEGRGAGTTIFLTEEDCKRCDDAESCVDPGSDSLDSGVDSGGR